MLHIWTSITLKIATCDPFHYAWKIRDSSPPPTTDSPYIFTTRHSVSSKVFVNLRFSHPSRLQRGFDARRIRQGMAHSALQPFSNPSSNSLPLTDICSVASVQHPAYHSSWHLHRNRRNIASTFEGVESSKRADDTDGEGRLFDLVSPVGWWKSEAHLVAHPKSKEKTLFHTLMADRAITFT